MKKLFIDLGAEGYGNQQGSEHGGGTHLKHKSPKAATGSAVRGLGSVLPPLSAVSSWTNLPYLSFPD